MRVPIQTTPKKGGRPRKTPVVKSDAFEAFKHQIWKLSARGRVDFFSADVEIMSKITAAKHGNRGALVRQLARKKGVSETTIWKHIPEIEDCIHGLIAINKKLDVFSKDLQRSVGLIDTAHAVEKELAKELRGKSNALAGAARLPLTAKKFVLSKLHSTATSVSDYAAIIDALERFGKGQTDIV
jgi:hypothetical protein